MSVVCAVACSDDGMIEQTGDEAGTSGSADDVDDGDPSTADDAPDPTLTDESGAEETGVETTTDDTAGTDTTGGPIGGTPGCGMAAEAGATEAEIEVEGMPRTFVLVVPDGYDPSTPLPLVFAYHGRGSNANEVRLYFGLEAPAAGGAIFVYPNGLPLPEMNNQTGWDLTATGEDVVMFDALLKLIGDELCVDPERVFVTGHSFGGYMSNALGCFRAEVIRAIAPVAGGPAFGECDTGRVAAWMTHGTLDEIVPIAQGEAARDDMVERNACEATTAPVEPEPCVAYDGCEAGYDVIWCPHDSPDFQGHDWPEFAAAAIWSFFSGLAPEA